MRLEAQVNGGEVDALEGGAQRLLRGRKARVRGIGKAEREPGRAAAQILLRLLGCEVGVRVVDGLHDEPTGGRRGRERGGVGCGPA